VQRKRRAENERIEGDKKGEVTRNWGRETAREER